VIECVPAVSEAFEQLAWFETTGTLVQIATAPSLKVMVPEADRIAPDIDAVNVTAWPPFAGLSDEVSAMFGGTGAGGGPEGNSR
jgi:hypothetical protein